MNLRALSEAVREETVVRVLSNLVTAVNNLADLVGEDGIDGPEAASSLAALGRSLSASGSRVARLDVDQDTWESMSSGMNSAISTWSAARALIARRLVPEITASISLVLKSLYGPEAKAATVMLRERILNAQGFLTGIAPSGQAAADAVDEQPALPVDQPRTAAQPKV